MITIHSQDHRLRSAKTELAGGLLVPPFECPERVEFILERIAAVQLGPVAAPADHGLEPALRVHDADYVRFLETAWEDWAATGARGEAIPMIWPARRMRERAPKSIVGRLGYYALAADTSISKGAWAAARAAADVATSAADRTLAGAKGVFGLCRPPGHHAARDMFGGYCFLNNAAIAAQRLRDGGLDRVAILDIDFHHGNGTQDIFYARKDVAYFSIHGDPAEAFPYFLGYADELGMGEGEGFNRNFPLPRGAGWAQWREALRQALKCVDEFGADALVISLGVDAYEGDPISFFKLASDDFLKIGEAIGRMRAPTLFLMEGGYAIAEIGVNAVNVLTGFENA